VIFHIIFAMVIVYAGAASAVSSWCDSDDLKFGKREELRAGYSEKHGGYCDGEIFVASGGAVELVSFTYVAKEEHSPGQPVVISMERTFASVGEFLRDIHVRGANLSSKGNYKFDAQISRHSPTLEIDRKSALYKLRLARKDLGFYGWYESRTEGRVIVPVSFSSTSEKGPILKLRTTGQLANAHIAIETFGKEGKVIQTFSYATGLEPDSIVDVDLSGLPSGIYRARPNWQLTNGTRMQGGSRTLQVP
jgi:hypothetical protein